MGNEWHMVNDSMNDERHNHCGDQVSEGFQEMMRTG